MRYYFPVAINFYRATWKNNERFGGNFNREVLQVLLCISSNFKC